MLWDDPRDSKDKQRLKNLVFMKFYGTNEDRDAVMPWIGGGFLLLMVVGALFGWWKG